MPSSQIRRVNKLFCFALSVKQNTYSCCMLTAELNGILWERAQKQMDPSQKINKLGLLLGQLMSLTSTFLHCVLSFGIRFA